jgi:hypothetical protein
VGFFFGGVHRFLDNSSLHSDTTITGLVCCADLLSVGPHDQLVSLSDYPAFTSTSKHLELTRIPQDATQTSQDSVRSSSSSLSAMLATASSSAVVASQKATPTRVFQIPPQYVPVPESWLVGDTTVQPNIIEWENERQIMFVFNVCCDFVPLSEHTESHP